MDKQGYTRGFCVEQYCPEVGHNDTIEEEYRFNYFKKYGYNPSKYLNFPTIKESVDILISYPPSYFRKAKDGRCLDTIDVYINNKLYSSSLHPYTPGCWTNFPYLQSRPNFIYLNKKRKKEAHINIVLRSDKVYFDTIVPLRFKKIGAFYDLNREFSFFFEGALDSLPLSTLQLKFPSK